MLIGVGGFIQELVEVELVKGEFDLIVFGINFIFNFDLVEWMKNGWLLVKFDLFIFYGVIGVKGYMDYLIYDGVSVVVEVV